MDEPEETRDPRDGALESGWTRELLVRGIRDWDQQIAWSEEELASGDIQRHQALSRDLRGQLSARLRTLTPEAMVGLFKLFRREAELHLKLCERRQRQAAQGEPGT